MRKVILDLAVTLDGYIEGPKGEIDWCILDDDMQFDKFIESVDTIFYGRVSYDAWGSYQPDENANETEKKIWNAVHSKSKFVFSSQARNDINAEFINGDIAKSVNEIKMQNGKDIWLYGGAKLIETFIKENLIDVYRLSIHPIVLGKGKPLFENLDDRVNLKLTDANKFRSGVVQLIYDVPKQATNR
jgi:dihydrofolate reductase